MPTVAIAPQAQPNAFATGRDPAHAVVCVTEGLLGAMGGEELEGVIAHELAHIKNRDMLLMTVAATMAGAISSVGQMLQWGAMFGGLRGDDEDGSPVGALAMAIVAPIAAMLIQFAISRQREFKADRVGAEITGRPLGLARALRTLESGAHRIPMAVSPAMAPLAQVNPLAFSGGGVAKLFSTHPPTTERVAALERLAAGA
jgi:heat shock protein HtpX